jgi:1,4-alpha-glucan branching enzyme
VPEAAFARAREHAAHFVSSRAQGAALQVAPYDAELFGHWWLEGPAFLEGVLQAGEALTTPMEILREQPTRETRELPFSSWGRAGTAEVWLGPQNQWMWPHLHRAAEEMTKLDDPGALNELLLAQASDWPFLIDAKTSAGFAQEQFEAHLLKFRARARGEKVATTNPFPWASPSVYRESGGGKAQPAKGSVAARAGAAPPGPVGVAEGRRRPRSGGRGA